MHVLTEFDGEARTCRAQAVRNSVRRRGVGRDRKKPEATTSEELPQTAPMLPAPAPLPLPPQQPEAMAGLEAGTWVFTEEAGAGTVVAAQQPPDALW